MPPARMPRARMPHARMAPDQMAPDPMPPDQMSPDRMPPDLMSSDWIRRVVWRRRLDAARPLRLRIWFRLWLHLWLFRQRKVACSGPAPVLRRFQLQVRLRLHF
jgi:hypothetical protein